jgi:hypothetical protein
MVNIQGTPGMRSHISVRRATTKYFSNSLFSKQSLKRRDFQEIARLAWAKEASGSNPGAPTNPSSIFNERLLRLQRWRPNSRREARVCALSFRDTSLSQPMEKRSR